MIAERLRRTSGPSWAGVALIASALFACGPTPGEPPDAGSLFGETDGGSAPADAAPARTDAGRGTIDAGVSGSPDASPAGCERDPEGDTEEDAQDEGSITDCDDEGTRVSGTLDGADDVDYFRIATEDTAFCLENPDVYSRSAPHMCLFLDCSGLSVTCEEGTPGRSPSGLQGCCASGRIEIDSNCSGVTDEPDFYLEVSEAPENECVSYDIDVHY